MDRLKFTDDQLPGALESFLKEFLETKADLTTGAIITVVHKGKAVLHYPFGYANAEKRIPVTADRTLFRIASVTKSFTAATFLTNWENKGFPPADIKTRDVNDIIAELEEASPEFSIQFRVDSNGFSEPITVWNLLTHTAGFEDAFLGMDSYPGDDLSEWKLDPRLYNRTHLLNGNFPKRVYPPNTAFSYSNGGFILLGYLIELLCRQPYPDALRDTVLKPLGMKSSSAAINYAKDPVAIRAELPQDNMEHLDYAEPHVAKKSETGVSIHKIMPLQKQMRCLSMSDGSLALTATDMSKYMICILNGGRFEGKQVLSPFAIELMTTKQFEKFEGSGLWSNAGLMEQIAPHYNGLNYLEHGGFINGHLSKLMLFPKYELGIFYSVNNNSSELQHGMIVNHLFESVPFDEQEKVTFNYHQTPPKKIPLDIAPESKFDLKRFAGYYRTTRFHHSTYLAMFGMSYYPEICISVSKGGNSLRYAGTELIPLYEGEKQVVFWVKNETEGKLPSNRYTTMAFEDVKSSKPNVYMFFTNGAAHKLRWFERKAVQNSIYFSSIGLASSQLAYGALYFALSSRIANLPKVSLAATAIGLGINLFPLTNYIQDKTKKNEVELMSKRPPLWGKVCVALSQTTAALGAGYILLKYGGKKVHPQEVLALLAAGSYLGFIHYWNFECWKL